MGWPDSCHRPTGQQWQFFALTAFLQRPLRLLKTHIVGARGDPLSTRHKAASALRND